MYHGDFHLGDTLDIKFCTVQTTGAPFTLAGSPAISAYPSNGTTQLTAGITLSVDFDGVTGLNNVRVVATTANGYLTGTNYTLVITAGTVNGVSVVGYTIGSFSLENRTQRAIRRGTAQAGAASTITLDASASAIDNFYRFTLMEIVSGTGVGQSAIITSYVGSTKVATVGVPWSVTPDSTSVFAIWPSGVISGSTPPSVAEVADGVWDELRAGHVVAGSYGAASTSVDTQLATIDDFLDTEISAIKAKTDNLPTAPAAVADIAAALDAAIADSIPADGTRPSVRQALYMLIQFMLERGVVGTTLTVRKPDGTTPLFTLTLDSLSPTNITRAT